jgi:hypothetical protein
MAQMAAFCIEEVPMTENSLSPFLGWLGRLWPGGDARADARVAKRDACAHGQDDQCPFGREPFDCNDCEVDEATGETMPRM